MAGFIPHSIQLYPRAFPFIPKAQGNSARGTAPPTITAAYALGMVWRLYRIDAHLARGFAFATMYARLRIHA